MDSISNWLAALERRIADFEQQRKADAARIAELERYVAEIEKTCGEFTAEIEEATSDAA